MTRRVTFRLALLFLVDFTWGLLVRQKSKFLTSGQFDMKCQCIDQVCWWFSYEFGPLLAEVLSQRLPTRFPKYESLSCCGVQHLDILLFSWGGRRGSKRIQKNICATLVFG